VQAGLEHQRLHLGTDVAGLVAELSGSGELADGAGDVTTHREKLAEAVVGIRREPALTARSASSTARSSRSSCWSSSMLPKALYATVSSSRIRDRSSPSRGSRLGAGALTYTSRGNSPDSWYSSSRPETSSAGATQPYRATTTVLAYNRTVCSAMCKRYLAWTVRPRWAQAEPAFRAACSNRLR
jgi:hypothetical protein